MRKERTLEERVDILEEELQMAIVDKDERISAVHSDMAQLRDTVSDLTEQVRDAVFSLKQIAKNTTTMSEITDLYSKWKGFIWVAKSAGFWVAIIVAFIVGVMTAVINL